MYVDTACSRECNLAVQTTLQTHQKRARAHTNKTRPLSLSLSLGSYNDCFTAKQLTASLPGSYQRKKIQKKS